ncbi:MAG: hypothetical protein FWG66_04295, partial [Spirochaetes bacterium]|nr:hypothetical protein [Spirochaetota bacterium]
MGGVFCINAECIYAECINAPVRFFLAALPAATAGVNFERGKGMFALQLATHSRRLALSPYVDMVYTPP